MCIESDPINAFDLDYMFPYFTIELKLHKNTALNFIYFKTISNE